MATLSITIPDAVVPRVRAAFAAQYDYRPVVDGQPNPETLAQFTARKIREYVKGVVKAAESLAAAETARRAAADRVESEITLT
jgi:hypothetical protein